MKRDDESVVGVTTAEIRTALDMCGIDATPGQCAELLAHAGDVLEANRRLNLTRITVPKDVLWLHIVDSLAWLPLIGRPELPMVDMGSGAGYPGIPLSVMLGGPVVLCESIRKKAEFLQQFVQKADVPCDVYHGRLEDLARAEPKRFTTAVARALSSLSALVELAAPLLCRGGTLYALKGQPTEIEVAESDRVAAICGMRRTDIRQYGLPIDVSRTLVVYTSVGEPRITLPRRPGLAQHAPPVP